MKYQDNLGFYIVFQKNVAQDVLAPESSNSTCIWPQHGQRDTVSRSSPDPSQVKPSDSMPLISGSCVCPTDKPVGMKVGLRGTLQPCQSFEARKILKAVKPVTLSSCISLGILCLFGDFVFVTICILEKFVFMQHLISIEQIPLICSELKNGLNTYAVKHAHYKLFCPKSSSPEGHVSMRSHILLRICRISFLSSLRK